MSQLTADKSRKFKLSPDEHTEQPVDAATQIFMGSMVSRNPATNFAHQLVGGEDFLGFAFTPAWNIVNPYTPNLTNNGVLLGAAGAINVELRTTGVAFVPLASVAGAVGAANIEAPVYATDGDTLTLGTQTTTVTITGSPTGGTGTFSGNGSAGTAVAYNATAATFLAGLPAAVSGFISGVTGSAGGPYTIAWTPGVTPYALTLSTNSYTGGTSPGATIGAATASTSQSKIGTIRSYLFGQFEILFKALSDKVS